MELSLTRTGCGGSLGGTTGLTGKSSCILHKAFTSIVVRSAFGIPSAVSARGLNLDLDCYFAIMI